LWDKKEHKMSKLPALSSYFSDLSRVHVDVVDAQNDFMQQDGALSVNPPYCKGNAAQLIEPMALFMRDLPAGSVADILLKFDTHLADEYAKTNEAKDFPPHVIYGTKGWDLVFPLEDLAKRHAVFVMSKNVLDMWQTMETGVSRDQIAFANRDEAQVYDNHYRAFKLGAGEDPAQLLATRAPQEGMLRDDFMKARRIGPNSTIIMFGVASDYCNRFNLAGYLRIGAKVVVVEDLTAGVGGEKSVAPITGSSREVAENCFTPQLASGQLVLAKAAQVQAEIRSAMCQQGLRAKLAAGRVVIG
jgi:nicotinamidase/pyrazinamidase